MKRVLLLVLMKRELVDLKKLMEVPSFLDEIERYLKKSRQISKGTRKIEKLKEWVQIKQ